LLKEEPANLLVARAALGVGAEVMEAARRGSVVKQVGLQVHVRRLLLDGRMIVLLSCERKPNIFPNFVKSRLYPDVASKFLKQCFCQKED
jgi:hypothetical protein